MKLSRIQIELRITILYAIFGAVWILFTDFLLNKFVADHTLYARIQTYKGWFFVAASATLIFYFIKQEITKRNEIDEKLRESEKQYRGLFEHMTEGYAYCKMLFENDQAIDWVYLKVNEAFEALTGLKEAEGKRVSEIIPGIRASDPELFGIYSRVALTGEPEKFEIFLEALKMWFSVSVYSPEMGYFVAVFDVITERKRAEEKIASLSKFPTENPNPVLRVQNDGQVLYANATSQDLLEMWGCEVNGYLPAEMKSSVADTVESDSIKVMDIPCNEKVYSLMMVPVPESGYVNLYGSDITERKRAELALSESEGKYRNLFNNMNEGFGLHEIILDAEGKPCDYRFLELNDSFEKLTGLSREKAQGRTVKEILPNIDLYWIKTYGAVALTGKPIRYVNYSTPFGKWYETYAYSPKKNQFAVMFFDITERKRAEDALRESEERLRLSLHAAKQGLYDLNVQTGAIVVNSEYAEMLGYDPETFTETNEALIERLHPDDEAATQKAYQDYIDGVIPEYQIEFRQKTKEGNWKWILSVGKVVEYDSLGKPLRMLGTHTDITERKHAEEKLQRTLDDLRNSNAELEQFAYVASHDLQEPLRGIAGLVQLLQHRYQGQLDSRADEYIEHIVDGTQRMQALINDLLAYSRVGRRAEPIQPTEAEIALQVALGNLNATIRELGASIKNESLPTVRADPIQLTQLFQNLIGNSLKFKSESSPQIHVGVSDAGAFWQFSVQDNGIGIEPQYFERIFQVFQRLHTRREYKGTGIGLAICKKIIERHGGHIWVESEMGQGSTFYFTLLKGD